ncbi:MAG: OadG family protein [Clostridiales bacterium]|nr:OadG family protein [Clostridiales bacterium]MCC8100593.1 OadG family protein [Clostridiales bacterium]
MEDITIVQTLGVAVLGMLVVFAVLLLLMGIITVQSKIIQNIENKKKASEPVPATPAPAAPAAAPAPSAKGSCGGVMLHDVPDRTAAMIMAIVADGLNTPLNELRFISIKEVK